MAGLGAGAGAFEGDQERARQAEARARINQQARQFDAQLRQRRDESQQAAAERAQNREDTLNMRADERDWRAQENQRAQGNSDRQFGLAEGGQEFSQKRAAEQDEWTKALNEQNMAKQKQEMEFASAKFNEWKTLADQEREELNQRKLLAQTAMASLMWLARDNGGVAPLKAVQAAGQELGLDLEGASFDNDGVFVVNAFTQDEHGQKVAVPNFFPPAIQAQMMRAMPGIFGEEAAKSLETSVRDKARYDSVLQRSDARAESGTKLGEGAKAKIKVLTKRLAEAYDELDYANAPDEQAEWQSKIDQYSAEIDAIESGGQASVGVTSAGKRMSDVDRQALAWAKANPKDPRAEKIMKKLGGK